MRLYPKVGFSVCVSTRLYPFTLLLLFFVVFTHCFRAVLSWFEAGLWSWSQKEVLGGVGVGKNVLAPTSTSV
jgi:hypothetical protein